MENDQQVAAPQQRRNVSGKDWVSLDQAITLIAPCFALVRPVSMDEDAATEWLNVAAAELVGYPHWSVSSAAAAARRDCTHHGQILPFMMKHMESNYPHFNPNAIHNERAKALASAQAERIEYTPEIRGMIDHAVKGLTGARQD